MPCNFKIVETSYLEDGETYFELRDEDDNVVFIGETESDCETVAIYGAPF